MPVYEYEHLRDGCREGKRFEVLQSINSDKLISCPHCGALFKKREEAMIRSLIMPGLGSIYLSCLPLGVMEISGYLAVWLTALILVILRAPGGMVTAILLVLAYHGLIGFMAFKMAGKGYVLLDLVVKENSEDQLDGG